MTCVSVFCCWSVSPAVSPSQAKTPRPWVLPGPTGSLCTCPLRGCLLEEPDFPVCFHCSLEESFSLSLWGMYIPLQFLSLLLQWEGFSDSTGVHCELWSLIWQWLFHWIPTPRAPPCVSPTHRTFSDSWRVLFFTHIYLRNTMHGFKCSLAKWLTLKISLTWLSKDVYICEINK